MFKKFNIEDNFGLQKEIELLPTLKSYFKDEILDRLDKNNEFDYVGNRKFIELKSRNNN